MVRKEARKWRQTSTALNDLLLYGYNARLLLNATLAHLDTYAADRVLTGPVPPCMTGACRPPGRHDPTVFADRHEVTFATTNDKYAELCPSRSGDFRHPTDRQKFYRCNEFYYTLEDCGDGFYFDSTRRFCLPYAKAATSVERDMEALLPKEETDTSTNGSVTTMHGTAGWLCAEDRLPAGRQWDLSRAGVSGCWAEALRRRARHLAVGLSGCLYGDLTSLVTGGPCSNRSLHVIDVQQHQKQISKLRPGAKLWITGSDLDGIQWVPVNLNGPATLRTCTEACVEQGAGFSRVDHQGCRCGLSSGPTSITTALPVWRDALPAAVTPAIILSLWLRLPRGASCSPGAASVAEDPTAVQGTIDFCESRRRKNYTTGGWVTTYSRGIPR
ncbi:hypothetical protein FJT64_005581 [Amphibalanus amphitrite]|uniref:Chitin-binding type-2 domain-containing protein n=1 Tax=Amphibalanus amphitrite TaxID=1232801 RepID=A0A6A4VS14_AMPAM|nr:hypothetical protein FJT64_005581 [Amphibalanus amphitrite]